MFRKCQECEYAWEYSRCRPLTFVAMADIYGPSAASNVRTTQNGGMESLKVEIADTAARLIVEDGMEYGVAKRQAVKMLGLPARTGLPDNDQVASAVESYIAIFCADTQPRELKALRGLALEWMIRLETFRPHIAGAVWRGTATRKSDIYLQLFCDDSKSTEISLIDMRVRYESRRVNSFRGELVDALSVQVFCNTLNEYVGLHLLVHDFDDLRGALRSDSRGRKPRGDTNALRNLLNEGMP